MASNTAYCTTVHTRENEKLPLYYVHCKSTKNTKLFYLLQKLLTFCCYASVARGLCLSVCLSVMFMYSVETNENMFKLPYL